MRYVHFQFCTTWVALSMVCFELGWMLAGFAWLAASVLSFVLWMVARNTKQEIAVLTGHAVGRGWFPRWNEEFIALMDRGLGVPGRVPREDCFTGTERDK